MKTNKTYPITAGWWGTILTVAIVAIRAFQPDAEPMSSWTTLSWVWMTIPCLLPLWMYAVVGLARLLLFCLELLLDMFKRH